MGYKHSPLRYPGGKQILGRIVAHLIHMNGAAGGTYIEPYAGGAGVALVLLYGEHVDRVVINDADPCIFAFWNAVLNDTERFVRLLHTRPATVEEWSRQRHIYQHPAKYSMLSVGFATFYLNRCNRSGIIATGGPIGGLDQTGRWKIDARLNRKELERRVRKIAEYRERITIANEDAIDLLKKRVVKMAPREKPFVYLDPPYYGKGKDLYLSYYEHKDHERLARFMAKQKHFPWIMSYDGVRPIVRLYEGFRQVRFSLGYSARERRVGSEVMILRDDMAFPKAWVRTIPSRFISSHELAPALPAA